MDDRQGIAGRESANPNADAVREVLGYLNFSGGKRDPRFLARINELWQGMDANSPATALHDLLGKELTLAKGSTAAFENVAQAAAVIDLTLLKCLPAYKAFHNDLLFHLDSVEFEAPFLLGCMFEAVLSQGEPWSEVDRIVKGAIGQLNDFIGYRPVAVLENGRKMEVYAHERFRALPAYVADAGVAHGRYHDLLTRTIEFLRETPEDVLEESHFNLARMQELCVDMRAHDHLHPVNKRTNYLFGEWDPHQIDTKGYYRRFIVRQTLLDALCDWIEDGAGGVPFEERLFDASAALCGTMLMASSISGSGPDTHDSTVSLTTLLPIVARRRDAFYQNLMSRLSGPRARRLEQERERTQQPFGHIRQHLNMSLAGLGAHQIQHRSLAHLYARMGQSEASRELAMKIPACSIRIECEILCEFALAGRLLDEGHLAEAADHVFALPDLINRGIECGGLADPWNILGFQGNFPLFHSREDAIPDTRLETLVDLMADTFANFSRVMAEAAATGDSRLAEQASHRYRDLADWWDKFASETVTDLPHVSGSENWESSTHVSRALSDWRAAGESAGDLTFWRQHADRFQSARSYALVIDALLNKRDYVSSLGLICQWLHAVDEVGVEAGRHSIYEMLLRWSSLVVDSSQVNLTQPERVTQLVRFVELLEANAGEYWSVPELDALTREAREDGSDPLWEYDEQLAEDDEDNVFGAAYEGVVFRDSADDGNWGDTLDDDSRIGLETEFEEISRRIETRLKFLNAIGQVWQMSSALLSRGSGDEGGTDPQMQETIQQWQSLAHRWESELWNLMTAVNAYKVPEPSGDQDANVEFDIQFQVKQYLLQQIVSALLSMRNAMRMLQGALPPDAATPLAGTEQELSRLYADILRRDAQASRQRLPKVIQALQEHPLLYVPLEHGGDPEQLLRAQAMQSVLRFLLRELPRLGMLKETWHVLKAAFQMERKWRPDKPAVTEFDRLFEIALRNCVRVVLQSAREWPQPQQSSESIVEALDDMLTHFEELWTNHADTMRLSTVDGLKGDSQWREVRDFIESYGQDLFHATQLQLGNVRTILHRGVDWYLDYLEQEADPLHPIRLIEALKQGEIDRDDAVWCLETIYSIVVDKFDRFLEYNTTTTQSDYGEKFYSLLDFLNVETQYDREAWLMTPQIIAHEMLCRLGWPDVAFVWEDGFRDGTSSAAAKHLHALDRLEVQHGMRLPTISDHLKQRFVKPMLVSRMLSRIQPAMAEIRAGDERPTFETLHHEISVYLEDSWGSGIDIPIWIRQLQHEVEEALHPDLGGRPGPEADLNLPALTITRADFSQQIRTWQSASGEAQRRPSGNKRPGGRRRPPQGGGRKRRKDD